MIPVPVFSRRRQREFGMGILLVTRDVCVAADIADRIAVMYAGRIVEKGPVADVLRAPMHPYTRGRLTSMVRGDHHDGDIRRPA
jgi:peptide/nickel transport system ATP-binding protein